MSIRDRIAMFQKLSGNSTTAPSFTGPIAKLPQPPKNTPPTTFQPKPLNPPQNTLQTSNKTGGTVQSPIIVKPSKFSQPPKTTPPTTFQQKPVQPPPQTTLPSSNKTGGTVQSPTIVKPSQARQSQSYNTQNISNNVSNNLVSSTFTAPVNLPPVLLVKESSDAVVKVTENGSVDKESLPKANAMKELLEGKMVGLNKKPEENIWKKKVQVPKEEHQQKKDNPWVKNTGQPLNQNNPPTWVKETGTPQKQVCPPWRMNNEEKKPVEPEHSSEAPKNNQPAWIKNTGQPLIQLQAPSWKNNNAVVVEHQNTNQGPRETPVIETGGHVGSVKDSAKMFSQFYKNQLVNQKAKAEQEQANRNRQKEQANAANEELASIKNQERRFAPEQDNSQNIPVSDPFSRANSTPVVPEGNSLNVGAQEVVSAEVGVESGENSLAARLKKRKQMRKANFSSDDD